MDDDSCSRANTTTTTTTAVLREVRQKRKLWRKYIITQEDHYLVEYRKAVKTVKKVLKMPKKITKRILRKTLNRILKLFMVTLTAKRATELK